MGLLHYIAYNPLRYSIIEAIVFTVICVGWDLLFDFALESRFPTLFPVSVHGFYFLLLETLLVLLINHTERLRRFTQIEDLADQILLETKDAKNLETDPKYLLLSTREDRMGVGFRGLATFCTYLTLMVYPWLLWGYYRWFSVIVFVLFAWILLALMRYTNRYPHILDNTSPFYSKTETVRAAKKKSQ